MCFGHQSFAIYTAFVWYLCRNEVKRKGYCMKQTNRWHYTGAKFCKQDCGHCKTSMAATVPVVDSPETINILSFPLEYVLAYRSCKVLIVSMAFYQFCNSSDPIILPVNFNLKCNLELDDQIANVPISPATVDKILSCHTFVVLQVT